MDIIETKKFIVKLLEEKKIAKNDLSDKVFKKIKPNGTDQEKIKYRGDFKKYFKQYKPNQYDDKFGTAPFFAYEIARAINVSIDELYFAKKLKNSNANRLTLYSVSKQDDVDVFLDFEKTFPDCLGSYDEYGKNFLDYLFEFESINIISYLLKNKKMEITTNSVWYNYNTKNLDCLFQLIKNKKDKTILKEIFDPYKYYNEKDNEKFNSLSISQENIKSLLANEVLVDIICDEYKQENFEWRKKRFQLGNSFSSYNNIGANTTFLHGAFNLFFEAAINTKNITLIKKFLCRAIIQNKNITNNFQSKLKCIEDGVYYCDEGRKEYYPTTNRDYIKNDDELDSLLKDDDLYKQYKNSIIH